MKKNLSPSKMLEDYIERHKDRAILEVFFRLNKDDLDDNFFENYSTIYDQYKNNKLDTFVEKMKKNELLRNSNNLSEQYKKDLNEAECFKEGHRPSFRCFKKKELESEYQGLFEILEKNPIKEMKIIEKFNDKFYYCPAVDLLFCYPNSFRDYLKNACKDEALISNFVKEKEGIKYLLDGKHNKDVKDKNTKKITEHKGDTILENTGFKNISRWFGRFNEFLVASYLQEVENARITNMEAFSKCSHDIECVIKNKKVSFECKYLGPSNINIPDKEGISGGFFDPKETIKDINRFKLNEPENKHKTPIIIVITLDRTLIDFHIDLDKNCLELTADKIEFKECQKGEFPKWANEIWIMDFDVTTLELTERKKIKKEQIKLKT